MWTVLLHQNILEHNLEHSKFYLVNIYRGHMKVLHLMDAFFFGSLSDPKAGTALHA